MPLVSATMSMLIGEMVFLKIAVDSEHSLPPLCWHQESINSTFDFAAGRNDKLVSAAHTNNFTRRSPMTKIPLICSQWTSEKADYRICIKSMYVCTAINF